MKFQAEMLVAAHGQWDFEDGRSTLYVDLSFPDASGSLRAVVPEGLHRPAVWTTGLAELDFTFELLGSGYAKAKVRLTSWAERGRISGDPDADKLEALQTADEIPY